MWLVELAHGPPVQGSRHTRASPSLGHKNHGRTRAPFTREEAERARTIQPGEKKVQGDRIPMYKHLMGQKEQKGTTLLSEVPTHGKSQWTQTKTRKFQPDMHWDDGKTLKWVSKKDCGVSICEHFQIMTGSCHSQPAGVDPA